MNKILAGLLIALSSMTFAAEVKTVCIDRIGKDGKVVVDKSGKPLQDCKKMKVHKKLEGTKVPEKK
jgi:hypothetical protein